ncbi:unnamed protein product [Calicophoron daubneyi]|uniref:Uncharacterized protein n=1 Tax=Calicophoron daubneyi TaxID=300641 RepID=A0AAV2TUZ6_CALDB
MRHVACVKPGLSRSTGRSNFTSWVNQINANKFKAVKKPKSMGNKRKSNEDISVVIPLKRTLSDNENEMPQSVHTHSAISSPVLRNSDDAGPSDITSNSPHSVCSTPETRNLVELDHGVVVLTKSQRKRLAKRRKKAALSLSTIQ